MTLHEYRQSKAEQERTNNILPLVSYHGDIALDIGARDGHFSTLLTRNYSKVIALDLKKPDIHNSKVECVEGDVTNLSYPDNYFDLVFCAEVLEHIPCELLSKACDELARVTKKQLIIGKERKSNNSVPIEENLI